MFLRSARGDTPPFFVPCLLSLSNSPLFSFLFLSFFVSSSSFLVSLSFFVSNLAFSFFLFPSYPAYFRLPTHLSPLSVFFPLLHSWYLFLFVSLILLLFRSCFFVPYLLPIPLSPSPHPLSSFCFPLSLFPLSSFLCPLPCFPFPLLFLFLLSLSSFIIFLWFCCSAFFLQFFSKALLVQLLTAQSTYKPNKW